jgi:hypothetical protein
MSVVAIVVDGAVVTLSFKQCGAVIIDSPVQFMDLRIATPLMRNAE